MKPFLYTCLLVLPLSLWSQGTPDTSVIAEAAALAQPADSTAGALEAVERTAHATTWQITELFTNDVTGEVSVRPAQFVELADGLNWRDGSGAWRPTRSEFTRVPGGFAVTTGPHNVFLPDALEPDGVELITPDGLRLRSAPLCLSYFDPVSGESVILAEAQTAFAEQVAPNEIAYAAVLASPAASVHYVYERGSFHQNLVLHEAPPPPESFGLSSASRLEFLSEFSSDSPLPDKVARVIGGETDPLVRAQMVEPDLVDETLAFGDEFTLREGRAFRLGEVSENEPEVPVAKRFTLIDQRPILIEAVEHSRLKPWLDVLPQAQAAAQANTGDSGARTVSLGRRLPVAYASRGTARPFLAATRPQPGTGVVLDWEGVVSGSSDVTLKSDMTYKVVGATTLNGTTTLEGAVVKFTAGASLECFGPVVCKTDSARPCILTAADDDTVGQALPGSKHDPTQNYYANPALKIRQGGTQLHDLRVSHAQLGLFFYDFSAGSGNAVTHAQFVRCGTALQFNGYGTTFQNFRVGNVLMNNVGTAFYGYSFQGTNENLTLNGFTTVACDYNGGTYGTTSSLAFTNSLLVGTGSDYSGRYVYVKRDSDYNRRLTSPTGVFASPVAAGAHYLAANSTYRNVGSPNLTPSLAAEIKQRTTYPPVELTGTLANPTTLAPSIPRDLDTPDLGYHYPVLDRILNTVTVSGTLTLTNGVAIGLRGTQGLQVGASAQVTSEGRPLQMNRVVSCANVQEQWLATGGNTFMKLTSSSGYPRMDFRFTEFSVAQGRFGTLLVSPGDYPFERLSLRDCWLRCAYFGECPNTTSPVAISLVNNLVERCDLYFCQRSSEECPKLGV